MEMRVVIFQRGQRIPPYFHGKVDVKFVDLGHITTSTVIYLLSYPVYWSPYGVNRGDPIMITWTTVVLLTSAS